MITMNNKAYKSEDTANPISSNIFCADPTSVEYGGRLYVYGTNDQQQYNTVGDDGKNTYEHIKSLVMFSTADMVNWEYHGIIDTLSVAPWITNSWAPSIAARVEEDGLTHFYLYFSNNGCGVGVITATNPTGPWSDPLGKPLIYQNMPGLENCPAPFDPGVCIDENGIGWLAFGGGTEAHGSIVHTKTPKVVRLGKDMLSFDSEFVSIDAPYFFEASELNYIGGTYYYSYSTDWQDRSRWDYSDIPAPRICSMAYMTTKTPLAADSWRYRGEFFLNAGESGMEWCNNHTHFMTYGNKQYILNHTMHIQERMTTDGGFRCMCLDYLPIDEKTATIPVSMATRSGVAQTKALDAMKQHSGAEMLTSAEIWYESGIERGAMAAKALAVGAWTYVRGAQFNFANSVSVLAKGKGTIEILLDKADSPAAEIAIDSEVYVEYTAELFAEICGVHNVYFVFSEKNICLSSWRATRTEAIG